MVKYLNTKIAIPLNFHFEIGKHVYLEKAMTYNDQYSLYVIAFVNKYLKQIV